MGTFLSNRKAQLRFIEELRRNGVRPVTVPILVTRANQIGYGRQNTEERNWGSVQGEIEPGETHIDAAVREINEELGILPDQLQLTEPLLHAGRLPFAPGQPNSGYDEKFYFCLGIEVRGDVHFSLATGNGGPQAILEWRWGSPAEAVRHFIDQPHTADASEMTRRKGWEILGYAVNDLLVKRNLSPVAL